MQTDIPSRQESPLAWYGPDLHADADKWVIQLSAAEIVEIEVAANNVAAHDRPIVAINKDNFPLPLLGPRLKKLSTQLIDGIGFALLRRIPVERYSVQQAAAMFYGIGAHLGYARMQNASGHVLGHVCDLNKHSDEPSVRIYQTHERQTFHTDSSDIVGLLCLKKAKKGGESLLVSAVTIYNEMLEARPDLVRLLFDPIATDRRGEIPQGMQPYFSIPVYSWDRDNLTVMYQRQYIDSAQRFDDAMRLTSAHIQALDMFDEFANDPNLNLSMQLEPGDMQFVYNHGLLHDRTGFEDWPDLEERRHLLRLWLSAPNDRPLPAVFEERFGSVEIGNRGGITVPGAEPCAPLEPH
ncbi:MAG: TauD/TfdA family dioxygenase [Proteobacteria bacterium]|nr:TauD/TfdA family dioxygenase [Pseudomonadota bacterium]